MSNTDRLNAALAGRYRIERQLGTGGMATVYLAADLKHDRKVAVKVLKPELAAVLGAERFVVEIKTTASLQHPHILPLFDSGTADGFLYYVMPYIQGETIREKLNRETQFGVDEAVRITREVADALDYAHRHGVIHRDIKPENILLHDGRAMVMDFGIALAVSAAAGGRMTETGLSLGTPHYMSPEQATAEKEITARSDIYSLGSVAFEMLTGQPPHIGGSAQQVIMKIITESAEPVTKYRKSVPPNVAAAVAKAIEKLPADRFESAKAFADALANPAFATGAATRGLRASSAGETWRERAAVPGLVAAVVLALVAAALAVRKPAAPVSRYLVEFPAGKRLGAGQWLPFAVSHDGNKLVYLGETGRLWVRSRDQLDPVELAGTEGAFNPFFSPDDREIGFMAGPPGSAEIKTVPVSGGPPTTVTAKRVGGPGAGWGYDGYIYFDAAGVGPLLRVKAKGGADPEEVSARDSATGELQHNWPDPLPNGKGVLISVDRGGPGALNASMNNDIAVLDVATRKHKFLAKGVFARYAASGHLLFVTARGTLMAAPFDQDRMAITGTPVPLLEGINIRRAGAGVDLAVSRTGSLWYGASSLLSGREVAWMSRAGDATPVESGWSGDFLTLALSPDGNRVAISVSDGSGEQIWVKQLGAAKGTFTKLTFEGVNTQPRWHPSGNQLLFVRSFIATRNLQWIPANGLSQAPQQAVPGFGRRVFTGRWSPDGRWLLFESEVTGTPGRDVFARRTGGDTATVTLLDSKASEQEPSVSPDGKWLLFRTSTTGPSEIFVRPFPDAAKGVYQISNGGGTTPTWSRDGKEIFYRSSNNEIVSVPVLAGPQFATGEPRRLFSLSGVIDWDVAPGGQRFIVIRDRQGAQGARVVVVENFFEELKAKVKN